MIQEAKNDLYFINGRALSFTENDLRDPNRIAVSLVSGTRIMVYKKGVIDYAPDLEPEKWTLKGYSTLLTKKDPHFIYARLSRLDRTALLVFSVRDYNLDGSVNTITGVDEEGKDIIEVSEPSEEFYYVKIGSVTGTDRDASDPGIATVARNITYDSGILNSLQDIGIKLGEWSSLFVPHYDDPKDPTKLTWIEAKSHMGIRGGVTMYAMDKDVDVPSLASGLPFDKRTIWYNPDTQQIEVIGGTGGGSGEGVSNFWDLNNIPSWITNSKPKYSYSEIEGTPDLTKYALASQIPSLSGYATESWVEQQGYLTSHQSIYTLTFQGGTFNAGSFTANSAAKTINIPTTTSHISEGTNLYFTNARAVSALTETLKAYVTLAGSQTITGEKNFTGGLKVNGSPIVYDPSKKYWRLEGDLLVTGGVTMFGNEGTYTPSTIMDAINVDGTTISKEGGVLRVIGGTGGGSVEGLANVAYSGKYDDLIGKPTLLSSFTDDIVSGKYLPLSGGTLTNTLTIDNSNVGLTLHRSGQATPYIRFGQDANNEWGELGVYHDGRLVFWPLVSSQGGYNQWNTVWHSGNFNPSDYLPLSGGTLVGGLTINSSKDYPLVVKINKVGASYVAFENANGSLGELGILSNGQPYAYINNASNTLWHSGNDGAGSGLDADLLDGQHENAFCRQYDGVPISSCRGIGYGFAENGWIANGPAISIGYSEETYLLQLQTPADYTELYFRNKVHNKFSDWRQIAFTDSNVASATKIQTARTIWGQSFDGTSDVSGSLVIDNPYITWGSLRVGGISYFGGGVYLFDNVSNNANNSSSRLYFAASGYDKGVFLQGINVASYGRKRLGVFVNNEESYSATTWIEALSVLPNGNVGIGTTSPEQKLHVLGTMRSYYVSTDSIDLTQNGNGLYRRAFIGMNSTYGLYIEAGTDADTYFGNMLPIFFGWRGAVKGMELYSGGNLRVYGGITMYSDQRKKTILNHVELSLKQIANAPLIEHYYNTDEKKTTHVGSIAQYWYGFNDWFCKEDAEGYLTMEIQNAALASAISVARELDRYETKTDKTIKQLRKRICQLEEELERLKSA